MTGNIDLTAFRHLVRMGDEAQHRGDTHGAEKAYRMALRLIGGNECFELIPDKFMIILRRPAPLPVM